LTQTETASRTVKELGADCAGNILRTTARWSAYDPQRALASRGPKLCTAGRGRTASSNTTSDFCDNSRPNSSPNSANRSPNDFCANSPDSSIFVSGAFDGNNITCGNPPSALRSLL